jgi:osmotically inducible protein OsmC
MVPPRMAARIAPHPVLTTTEVPRMAQTRRAEAHWEGDLFSGNGTVSAVSSGRISALPINWRARAEASDTGLTSPEELLASAHASCFAMALSNGLAKAGTPATSLDVAAEVTADKTDAGFTVLASRLTVTGTVPGADQAAFQAAAEAAKDGCPISRALKGNVELSVTATLAA